MIVLTNQGNESLNAHKYTDTAQSHLDITHLSLAMLSV